MKREPACLSPVIELGVISHDFARDARYFPHRHRVTVWIARPSRRVAKTHRCHIVSSWCPDWKVLPATNGFLACVTAIGKVRKSIDVRILSVAVKVTPARSVASMMSRHSFGLIAMGFSSNTCIEDRQSNGYVCRSPDVFIVVPGDRHIVCIVRQPNSLTACWVNGAYRSASGFGGHDTEQSGFN